MKSWAALAIVVLLAAAGACGDSDKSEETAAAEKAYLDSVHEASLLYVANFKEFETLFGQAWPLPSMLFDALQQAGVGTAFDETVAALEKLEPPPRFESDHAILVAGSRGIASVDRDVAKAVADKDVTAFALANVALGQAARRMSFRLSGPVCESTDVNEDEAVPRECERLDEGEGGDYGKELYGLMFRLEIDVRPLAEFFVPQFATQERFALLARFKPRIVAGIEQVAASVRDLNPPAEFQQDHQRLLAYLDERLDNARSIPEVPESTPSGGPGSPGSQGPPGPPPECVAQDEFSEGFRRLVAVHFRIPPCGSPPPGLPPGPPG